MTSRYRNVRCLRSALIFNTAPMMSVSIKTRANCAWSVVMQRFPNLRPGQLSFRIDGLSCGQSAWTTTPTAQGVSVCANVHRIGVFLNGAHHQCTTMNPIRGRYSAPSCNSYDSSQDTLKDENGRKDIRRGDARHFPRPGFLDSHLRLTLKQSSGFSQQVSETLRIASKRGVGC
jgi:hypothetical protein